MLQIPTIGLENKIVGLFCFTPTLRGIRRTREVLRLWNSLKPHGQAKTFEILLVNHSSMAYSLAMAKLMEEFGSSIPWYFLPIDGRQLCKILGMGSFSGLGFKHLIAVDPGKPQSLNYFAFEIFHVYGLPSYPFTLEKAVMLEKQKQVEALVLSNLVSSEVHLSRIFKQLLQGMCARMLSSYY